MRAFTAKKIATLIILSLILSLGIVRWHGVNNVSYCFYSAGCKGTEQPKGNITVHTYGYPLAYRQTQTFKPNNSSEKSPDYAGYAETSVESLSFSLPSVIINVIFWFALLHLLSGFIRPRAKTAVDMNTDRGTAAKIAGAPNVNHTIRQ